MRDRLRVPARHAFSFELESSVMSAIGQKTPVGRRLLSGSALRLCNLVAGALVALPMLPFMVHRLGDRMYGFWSLAAAFAGYYGLRLLDLGLGSAVAQYLSLAIGRKDSVESRSVFKTALGIQLILGAIALLVTVTLAIATPLFWHNPDDAILFRQVIVILGVNAALGFPVGVYAGLLEAELRFDILSWLTLLGLALRTGLVVCALLAGGGLLALAWVTLLASLPVMMLQIWFARREAPWARTGGLLIDLQRARSLFSYSVYTFIASIADSLRFQIDPLIITAFVGLAAVTHYRIASVFMMYYLNASVACTGTIQQVLSRCYGAGDRAGMEEKFYFATKISLAVSIGIAVILIVWGKPFIMRWMGASYLDAYPAMAVLTAAVFLDVGQSPSINLLYATFHQRYYTYINLAEGIINLAVSIALARPLGILGVALGTLIAALAIRIAVQPWWVCRAVGLSYRKHMRDMGMNVLRSSLIIVFAAAVSIWGLRLSYLWLSVSAVFCALVFGAGCWMFLLTEADRAQLKAAVGRRDEKAVLPAL